MLQYLFIDLIFADAYGEKGLNDLLVTRPGG